MAVPYDAMNSATSALLMKPSGSSPSYDRPGSRHCQLGVSSRSESHRCDRHEPATSPRSSTTWSMERSVRHWLMASPPCPAPTTTVVVRTSPLRRSGDLDRDVGRVGDEVEHGRPLLRLRDERLDVVGRRIRVDVVGHLDVADPVADVAVHAEDAAHVHRTFDRGADAAQLDLAVLRDRGDAGGQAATQRGEAVLDGRRAVVLRREDLRVVDVEAVAGAVLLLLAQAEEALDERVAVRPVLPFGGRTPHEAGGL